jgi:glycosyltransferase involved in cell wall biosynthesis
MLRGRSIICFAHDWNGDPTSKTHIMRVLSRDNRIVWVSSIGMRRPTASRSDLRRLGAKLVRALDWCRQVEPNLFVVNPLAIPLPGVGPIDRLNGALLTASLRLASRRVGLDRPILWTFLPNVGHLVGRLGESMVVYHCVDQYTAFSGVPREALERMERDLVRRADVVLASAESLADERRRINPETHFVPHGIDVDHFARAADPAFPMAEPLSRLPRPVIGFFGLIADWVDLELVRAVAEDHPHGSVVLLGHATCDASVLDGVPNVHRFGRRPYEELPRWCRGFDLGIIPFRQNELTRHVNPLKMREYLAAGLPVVSTRMREVERYAHVVRLCDDRDGFRDAVRRALAEDGPPERRRRIDSMRPESWEARVEEISAVLERQSEASPREARRPAIPQHRSGCAGYGP